MALGPGAATGYHRHAHDYVVVPVLDGELELIGSDGHHARVRLQQGKSYFRNAGVKHDVINAGTGVMIFVEIELKDTGG
jgi:beta-alanine degradation protein BauB